ncbi:MAG: heme o synthase [Pseudanabaenaceae cyanobacterium]
MVMLSNAPKHWGAVIQSYVQLTKPKIIVLLLITTAGAMWLAGQGQVDPLLAVATLTGGALAAGSANTINCLYDQDIDRLMARTQWRPIPSGRVQPRHALIFAICLGLASFILIAGTSNLLSAGLAMAGIAVYVGVYTLWLKRSSTQNIVIGGAAGAIPPLVGWSAVTGDLSWGAWVLFGIVFFWTPPHFWALALMIREEYAKVGVPMLPVVKGDQATAGQIVIYTIFLVPITLSLVYPLGIMGWLYGLSALGLGLWFILKAYRLYQLQGDRAYARTLFKYSVLYLALLYTAMAVDALCHSFGGFFGYGHH